MSIIVQTAFEVLEDIPAAIWFTEEFRESEKCRFEFSFSLVL